MAITTNKNLSPEQFKQLTKLNNPELQWKVWWGEFYVTIKGNDMGEKLIRVHEKRIYFNDGTASKPFDNDDDALIYATKIINNK
jgi:hypothetical protein